MIYQITLDLLSESCLATAYRRRLDILLFNYIGMFCENTYIIPSKKV